MEDKENLKTLKDLKVNLSVVAPHLNWKSEVVEYDVARQEAIKWIKDNEKRQDETTDENVFASCAVIIEWIKHFFNITEEDLK